MMPTNQIAANNGHTANKARALDEACVHSVQMPDAADNRTADERGGQHRAKSNQNAGGLGRDAACENLQTISVA